MSIEDVYFPEQENFKCLLIKSHDISNIRFDNPEYKKILCTLDIYEDFEVSHDNFFKKIGEKLNLKDFVKKKMNFSLNTQLVDTTYNYLYEIIHIDLSLNNLPVEIYNGVGNLLKNDKQHIFGNVVLIKTEVKDTNEITRIVDCDRNELHNLLERRIRHYGVMVDDDNEVIEFDWYYEDPKKIIDEFMTDEYKFIECSFLKHNLQIYYTPGNNDNFERLINDKYNQMIILTKKTNEFYSDFTLKEFKDILALLKTDCPLDITDDLNDYIQQKVDEYKKVGRKFIFTKHRALIKAKNDYLKKENL